MGKIIGTIGKTVTSKGFLKGAGNVASAAIPLLATGAKAGTDIAAAKSAKDLAEANAQISKQDAQLQLREARENSIRELRVTRERISQGFVQFAAGGVVSNVGTPLLSALDEARRGHTASQRILNEGVIQSERSESRAGAELLEGKTVSRARLVSAGSTVLGSVTNAIGKKRGFNQTIKK